ncbi:McrB family protein [Empedobacter sp. ULE_I140]
MEYSFTKGEILKAIDYLDQHPEEFKGRASSTYDLVYEGKKYPPILVLSKANELKGGKTLTLEDFTNNANKAFEYLKELDFQIFTKNNTNHELTNFHTNIWIEKTITKNRIDRLDGPRSLGKALWSPQTDKRGARIYENMLKVKEGDLVLHLVDNSYFSGVSIVKNKAVESLGIEGTEWEGDAYLIDLKKYTPLKINLDRNHILNKKNSSKLFSIKEKSEVFYDSTLNLRQGAYLTPCSVELLNIINKEYYSLVNEDLPFVGNYIFIDKYEALSFNLQQYINSLVNANLQFNENLIKRFVGSLITKPFVILTGLAGSGKTKLAQSFIQWICESEDQYKIVPVGADWINREPLLGYPNGLKDTEYVTPDNGVLQLIIDAAKEENQEKPYFLLLDEMNLSHVERYFADFLSIMESNDSIKLYTGSERTSTNGVEIPQNIFWPKNLFIVGTVNIDETTYMFSPKVLDRANVIEFRLDDKDLSDFLSNPNKVDLSQLITQGTSMASSFLALAQATDTAPNENLNATLVQFFKELKTIGAEFGYRSAFEIHLLFAQLSQIDANLTMDEKIDFAVMQKLLPKLHGSRSKIVTSLEALMKLCLVDTTNFNSSKLDEIEESNIKYKVSFEKLKRMYFNALNNGFTSYAEA